MIWKLTSWMVYLGIGFGMMLGAQDMQKDPLPPTQRAMLILAWPFVIAKEMSYQLNKPMTIPN